MQSNYLVAYNQFKNIINVSSTADSGVTNTTAALLGECQLSYSAHAIPNFLHRRIISPRNAINGTTTTIMPPCSIYAGNINNMLLPAPIGITATTELLPAIIASIAACCTPQNSALSPTIRFNTAITSISYICAHQSNHALSASSLNSALFRFLHICGPSNPKN
jgi:hypothetical protein